MPYNTAYDPVSNVKIVSGATAYTNPVSNFPLFFGYIHPYILVRIYLIP